MCEIGGLLRQFWEPLRALSDADGGFPTVSTRSPRTGSARRFSRPTAASASGSQSRSAGLVERKGAMYPLSLSVRPGWRP